jgi:hypothetical protein
MCGGSVDGINAGDAKNALVLVGEDLDEQRLSTSPVLEDPCGTRAAGEIAMTDEQALDPLNIGGIDERLEIDAGLVAAA